MTEEFDQLQEDVNARAAAIHAGLDSAAAAAGEFENTPVDLGDEIGAIADRSMSFSAVVDALLLVADAIDELDGDSGALRASIGQIAPTQIVDLAPVRQALVAAEGLLQSVSANLSVAALVAGPQIDAAEGVFGLLIADSNFDGAEQ